MAARVAQAYERPLTERRPQETTLEPAGDYIQCKPEAAASVTKTYSITLIVGISGSS